MHLQCGRLIYKEWENQLSDSVDSATHPFNNWGQLQLSRVIYHSGPARVLGIRYLEPFWYRYMVFFLSQFGYIILCFSWTLDIQFIDIKSLFFIRSSSSRREFFYNLIYFGILLGKNRVYWYPTKPLAEPDHWKAYQASLPMGRPTVHSILCSYSAFIRSSGDAEFPAMSNYWQ